MDADIMGALDPRRAALLLLDFQQGVLPTIEAPEQLVERAARGIAVARNANMAVRYVRVAFSEAERAAIPARNKMFSRFAGTAFLAADTPSALMPAQIAPAAGEGVFTKTRVGAFRTTALHDSLQQDGIDTLVLGGIHTSGVVLSTIRDGADLDYRLFVVSDLCADPRQDVHRTLMEQVFPSQAEIIDLAVLTRGLEQG